ncbi:hypothetical protein BT67DRAFT_12401 [Trichocladium antarcticum]|uniref:Uncharacterized protein n=1 Tax=Trichocladium antarcticum TaxID=1450529 RepID=A0AAN6USR6_9PEZI|nr:hypothetical protein BT67DRAFT_12401 [Trichocladium antarcticum]
MARSSPRVFRTITATTFPRDRVNRTRQLPSKSSSTSCRTEGIPNPVLSPTLASRHSRAWHRLLIPKGGNPWVRRRRIKSENIPNHHQEHRNDSSATHQRQHDLDIDWLLVSLPLLCAVLSAPLSRAQLNSTQLDDPTNPVLNAPSPSPL